ncbi:MAG: winged helix-turn-helix domain-containing protein [Burkholderiales bacterium]
MSARLTLRIELGRGRLGPGKIELLEAIAQSGSLAAAARAMQMSYKRAWELLAATNELFAEPVAVSHPGRNVAGSTQLTPFGERVVALYRAIERRASQATSASLSELNAATRSRPTARHSPKQRRA